MTPRGAACSFDAVKAAAPCLALLALVACKSEPRVDPPPPAAPHDAGSLAPVEDAGTHRVGAPIVILMIGDGMGQPQIDAASHYRHGAAGRLRMHELPVSGQLITGSLTGLTDSAAAATTMSTGVKTRNRRVGIDRADRPLETLVERAHRLGLRAGVVSTAAITHATPGAFSAHRQDRGMFTLIADDQAWVTRPEVLLGGGANAYLPRGAGSERLDTGLIEPLVADGWRYLTTREELLAGPPSDKLLGLFAPIHLAYFVDRPAATTEPTLAEMTRAALDSLSRSETGFVLVVEGARIDMAAHENDLLRTVVETLELDAAVGVALDFARGRDDVLLLVTADHECGGLELTSTPGQDILPTARWRWLEHTNAQVPIYGLGPAAEVFAGRTLDNAWVHAAMVAWMEGRAPTPPPKVLVPEGELSDLALDVVAQTVPSDLGVGKNQLDRLRLDADEHGLAVGIDGLFEAGRNAVLLIVDVDFGAGTGLFRLAGALTDRTGRLDTIISSVPLEGPGIADFGIDFVGGSFGALSPPYEELYEQVGLRGLRPPFGNPANLGAHFMPCAFSEDARTTATRAPAPGRGFEAHLPWSVLYPGGKPPTAELAIAAILVDDTGRISSQSLPPRRAGDPPNALPGVVRVTVGAEVRAEVLYR